MVMFEQFSHMIGVADVNILNGCDIRIVYLNLLRPLINLFYKFIIQELII